MRIGSLFSGAGGLDMAVESVFGGDVVWQAEIDKAASKVLAHRFPGVPNLGDITGVDWADVPAVDVLCGGFPCQDVSAAGKRAGLKNGTRTGLFANLMVGVETLQPKVVVLENVLGLLTADGDEWPDSVCALHNEFARWERIVNLIAHKVRKARRKGNRDRTWWHRKEAEGVRASRRKRVALQEFRRERLRLVPRAIETVLRSLAEAGYDTQWTCLRASDVGAPHRRERVFILAHLADSAERGAADRQVGGAPPGLDEFAITGAGDGDCAGGSSARVPVLGGIAAELAAGRSSPADSACCSGCVGNGDDVRAGREARRHEPATGRGAAADSTRDGWDEGRPEPAGIIGGFDAALSCDEPGLALLPTPCAQQSGNSPEEHLRKKPGRKVVTDLAILVENGLLKSGGALLPTPTQSDGGGRGHLTRSGERGDELLLPGVARAYATGDLLPTPTATATATDGKRNDSPSELERNTPNLGAINHYLPTPAAADGQRGQDFARAGREGSGGDDLVTLTVKATRDQQWGKYQPAIERWESLTRPAPSPTEPNNKGNPRLSAAFSEWMLGWPAGWVTDPVIGISRNDQLRIVGNGVCPQQAFAALRWLLAVSQFGVSV